ncbi:MAG: hypothetical protein V7K97_05775 [Nostoc sp.]
MGKQGVTEQPVLRVASRRESIKDESRISPARAGFPGCDRALAQIPSLIY